MSSCVTVACPILPLPAVLPIAHAFCWTSSSVATGRLPLDSPINPSTPSTLTHRPLQAHCCVCCGRLHGHRAVHHSHGHQHGRGGDGRCHRLIWCVRVQGWLKVGGVYQRSMMSDGRATSSKVFCMECETWARTTSLPWACCSTILPLSPSNLGMRGPWPLLPGHAAPPSHLPNLIIRL